MSKKNLTDISAYDFHLPPELIAQRPSPARDDCGLMVLDCPRDKILSLKFLRLTDFLGQPGDRLVINNTKVLPVRLFAKKITGGKVEVLFLNFRPPDYSVLLKPPLAPGRKIIFPDATTAEVVQRAADGDFILRYDRQVFDLLDEYGLMPLPPYIRRKADISDREFYQTVYAAVSGSVAAPTAGLHFSKELLAKLRDKGVKITEILLHVGLGTFRPVKTPDVRHHRMLPEYYEISPEAAREINETIKNKKRLIAVGTSVVRTLEYSSDDNGMVGAGSGMADSFIYPGYKFKVVKNMLTNFHLPRSTPLLLVCALAGREKIFQAYQRAMSERWHFYSYGDAMLILNE